MDEEFLFLGMAAGSENGSASFKIKIKSTGERDDFLPW
jgi:hypothetical protein